MTHFSRYPRPNCVALSEPIDVRRRDEDRRRSRSRTMIKFGVGQPVTRLEDTRLLKGNGRDQHDTNLPGQLYAVFLRSPHAHSEIRSIETAAARVAQGV